MGERSPTSVYGESGGEASPGVSGGDRGETTESGELGRRRESPGEDSPDEDQARGTSSQRLSASEMDDADDAKDENFDDDPEVKVRWGCCCCLRAYSSAERGGVRAGHGARPPRTVGRNSSRTFVARPDFFSWTEGEVLL